jgi:uncharacterized DUF497 family protein
VSGRSTTWPACRVQALGEGFEVAASAFPDSLAVVDAGRNGEARQAVIGFAQTGRLLFVVHVEFEDDCDSLRRDEAIYASKTIERLARRE